MSSNYTVLTTVYIIYLVPTLYSIYVLYNLPFKIIQNLPCTLLYMEPTLYIIWNLPCTFYGTYLVHYCIWNLPCTSLSMKPTLASCSPFCSFTQSSENKWSSCSKANFKIWAPGWKQTLKLGHRIRGKWQYLEIQGKEGLQPPSLEEKKTLNYSTASTTVLLDELNLTLWKLKQYKK